MHFHWFSLSAAHFSLSGDSTAGSRIHAGLQKHTQAHSEPLTLGRLCAAAQAEADSGQATGAAGRRMERAGDSTRSGTPGRGGDREPRSTRTGPARNTQPEAQVAWG